MEWLNVTADQGLFGLFIGSFLSATLLPGGSEALLWAFLQLHPEQSGLALLLCTVGNTLGGMTTYACGRFLPKWQRVDALPHQEKLQRWGSPALLLSWLPLLGDALCLAAGWLRLHWVACLIFMATGKLLRYWIIVQAA
ncbi:MAG TPA: DedA family protein [Rhodocyclaceae bacterium]|nr:DedA family protein [Rhodocyclaceae bacterium]